MAVVHYFLSPILVAHGFIPVLLSNLLFMVAASYYHYLSFLGYDGKIMSLPKALLSHVLLSLEANEYSGANFSSVSCQTPHLNVVLNIEIRFMVFCGC